MEELINTLLREPQLLNGQSFVRPSVNFSSLGSNTFRCNNTHNAHNTPNTCDLIYGLIKTTIQELWRKTGLYDTSSNRQENILNFSRRMVHKWSESL